MTIPPNPHPEQVEITAACDQLLVLAGGLPSGEQSAAYRQGVSDMLAAVLASLANRPADDGEREKAKETTRDALMDSQYMAGVTAGWNAAQADDPEAALASLRKSRQGHLAGYAEAKALLALPLQPEGVERP